MEWISGDLPSCRGGQESGDLDLITVMDRAILSADLPLDLLHFIHGYRCIISTVEKIGMVITTGISKIC